MKHLKSILALVLALAIAFVLPLQSMAAGGKYVSEIYVAYGNSTDAARNTLLDKGFTPVEGNLNDGGNTFVMMGYKTTDNIRDAVTDLAVMNMRGDYSVEDYKLFLKGQKTQIADFLNEFMAVIREYRVNLKAGKTRAVYVRDILNNYTEDDTGMKMGDLLNSETLQDKVGVAQSIDAENPDKLPDLVTILLQGNAQVIKSIETLLSIATDTAEDTWLDRFAALDYDTLLDQVEDERPDLNTEAKRVQFLDNLYGEDAAVLAANAATLRDRLNDYAAGELKIATAKWTDCQNVFGDFDNDMEARLRYQSWLSAGTVYEELKNYEGENYAKGELLDFFLEENDPEDTELFIPMAAALSDGQRYGLPFVDLEGLLRYALTTDDGWKKFVDHSKTNFDGIESVSVYQNIDRGIYQEDGSVALTGTAQRANNTADGTTGSKESQMDTLSTITAISWVATFGSTVATVISTAISDSLFKDFAYDKIAGAWVDTLERVIRDENVYKEFISEYTQHFGNEKVAQIAAQVGKVRFAIKIAGIFQTITVFLIVASAFMTIIDMERDKSVEQLPIPNYLVDNYTDAEGGSYTLNYKAVECNRMEYFGEGYKKQKGSSADMMADEGKQWLVLYASKNSKAGRPLTPDFIVQADSKAPSGYDGFVHLIGEKGAVNVVSGAFKNYSTFSQTWQTIAGDYTQYIFMKLSNDVKTYDEAAGNMTATTMSTGKVAIFGIGGLAIGAVLGAVVTSLVKKKKKAQA